jgi:adenine-specific DNA-methyltransferase
MKGFVPTPRQTVDEMVARLFISRPPTPKDSVLDPGCGTGEFIDGIIRWCERHRLALPKITGVESDPRHLPVLINKFQNIAEVRIEHRDFLTDCEDSYDFVIGNPPYVAITALSEEEKAFYRRLYSTARGRFDLYILFFEQALRCLAPKGRLVFITPEKYLYVDTAAPLRSLLAAHHVEEILFLREDTFGEFVTYPTITILSKAAPGPTYVQRRDGSTTSIQVNQPDSWMPLIETVAPESGSATLSDLCLRISCGIATGADGVFVLPADGLVHNLQPFAYPTVSGRQLTPGTTELPKRSVMLTPYDAFGKLLPVEELGTLGTYLSQPENQKRLRARTCVRYKPWYAFHETPLLQDILRPKIMCKDICEKPHFWIDRKGKVVPRHSVYYLVPENPATIDTLVNYLHSQRSQEWLNKNCQRASKGYLRLQSRVLQRLPVPEDVVYAVLGSNNKQRARFRAEFQPSLQIA